MFQPEFEAMPREALEALQVDRLKATLARVHANVPLYRDKFDQAGFDPGSFSSLDDLADEQEVGGEPGRLDRVEFLVGEEVVFVDREPPFECFHDFGEESRSWIVRVIAYHTEGVTVSDASITRKMPFAAFERVNRVILWVSAKDKDSNPRMYPN